MCTLCSVCCMLLKQLVYVCMVTHMTCNCTFSFIWCMFILKSLFFLLLAGPPSPPQTPSSTVQQYGRDSVTLMVQWEPPQYNGGAPVNYTITVGPGVGTFTTSGTSVPLTVSYNMVQTVSIVATNCNGSSSPAMVTIRIGVLKWNNHTDHFFTCLCHSHKHLSALAFS